VRNAIRRKLYSIRMVIGRPVEEVFAYVMDVSNWPKWNTYLLEVAKTSKGPLGVGTTFRGVSQFLRLVERFARNIDLWTRPADAKTPTAAELPQRHTSS